MKEELTDMVLDDPEEPRPEPEVEEVQAAEPDQVHEPRVEPEGHPSGQVLYLCSGGEYHPDGISVDFQERSAAAVAAREACLPFKDAAFRRVELPLLESRLGYPAVSYVLAECFRVLVPGGELVVTFDDAGTVARLMDESDGDPRARVTGMQVLPQTLVDVLLSEAGFEVIRREVGAQGDATTVARRRDSRVLLATARAKHVLWRSGWARELELDEQQEIDVMVDELEAIEESLDDARDTILRAIVTFPPMAEVFLATAGIDELAPLQEVAAKASAMELHRVLWERVRILCRVPTELDDPFGAVARAALELLSDWETNPDLDLAAELSSRLELHHVGHEYPESADLVPSDGPFLRSRMIAAASRLLAKAVKAMDREETEAARKNLILLANLRHAPQLGLRNMAVLQVRRGNVERALSYLEAARLAESDPERIHEIDREIAGCLAELGEEDAARNVLSRWNGTQPEGDPAPSPAVPRPRTSVVLPW